ncbi:MAG: hypothetical protein ACRDWG_08930 [Actinomycetes bacterium]
MSRRYRHHRALIASVLAVAVLVGLAACSDSSSPRAAPATPTRTASGTGTPTGSAAGASALPQGSQPVQLDPAAFTTEVDNPYWPMVPGTTWVYTETDADGTKLRTKVTVTDQTKMVAGIEARVIHDVVSEGGQVVEDTFDWYAQDAAGNIWYLGEDTKEFEDGKLKTTAGSWETGVDGAQAGVIIPAQPLPGMAYRQEYYQGKAEDNGAVLSLEEFAKVPFGSFHDLLMTRDTTPLEPDLVEYKFYAKDVGPILTAQTSGGFSQEVLVKRTEAGG